MGVREQMISAAKRALIKLDPLYETLYEHELAIAVDAILDVLEEIDIYDIKHEEPRVFLNGNLAFRQTIKAIRERDIGG